MTKILMIILLVAFFISLPIIEKIRYYQRINSIRRYVNNPEQYIDDGDNGSLKVAYGYGLGGVHIRRW